MKGLRRRAKYSSLKVLKSFKSLRKFLNETYRYIWYAMLKLIYIYVYTTSKSVRSSPAVTSIKNGKEFYDAVLKWYLGVNMTAHEVK